MVRFRLGTVDASGALVSVSKSRGGDAGVDLLPAIDFGGQPVIHHRHRRERRGCDGVSVDGWLPLAPSPEDAPS